MNTAASVRTILLRGSGRANVLDADALARLEVELWRAAVDGVGAAVLQGPPGRFAAGADLSDLQRLDGPRAHVFARAGSRLFRRLETAPFWLLAAVEGHCIGGGFDVALACDLVIASRDAVFRHPGGRFGFPTAYGGNRRLPARLRRTPVGEVLLRGRDVGAAEAEAMGLVAEVCAPPQLRARAVARAQRILDLDPRGMRVALQETFRSSARLPSGPAIARERAAARWYYAGGAPDPHQDAG